MLEQIHQDKKTEIVRLIGEGKQTFFLFGARGIGKRTVVKFVAKQLKYSLEEYETISIQQARDLKRYLLRIRESTVVSFSGDAVSEQVYNALLKIFEEPPSNTVFFVSGSKYPITTVLSRCSIVNFSLLARDELVEILKFKGMSEKTIQTVVPLADGSVEKALSVYIRMDEKKKMFPYLQALHVKNENFIFKAKLDDIQLSLLRELVEDFISAKYGIKNHELLMLGNYSIEFLEQVLEYLNLHRNPLLAFVGAYFGRQL